MQYSAADRARLLKWRRVEPGPEPTPCWIWTGSSRNEKGYGGIKINKRTHLVHKVSYLMDKGPIPGGFELDHLCHNVRCFNPKHLEPVTHSENVLRGRSPNLEKEVCLRGHPFHYRLRSSTGRLRRDCRTCFNAAQKERWRKERNK